MTASVVSLDAARAARHPGLEPWMTKPQLADHLGFSTRWVELRVKDGMPHERMGGRLRFRASVVERWLAAREEKRPA